MKCVKDIVLDIVMVFYGFFCEMWDMCWVLSKECEVDNVDILNIWLIMELSFFRFVYFEF